MSSQMEKSKNQSLLFAHFVAGEVHALHRHVPKGLGQGGSVQNHHAGLLQV